MPEPRLYPKAEDRLWKIKHLNRERLLSHQNQEKLRQKLPVRQMKPLNKKDLQKQVFFKKQF
jgi:hypothetical protein